MLQGELAACEIRRRIGGMLEARVSGRIDHFLPYFARDAVIHCASSREGLLPRGVWRGLEALRSITERSDENYLPLEHEIQDIVVDGQRAVVRLRGEWRRHANSKIYTIDAAHFLRWENGLVVEMFEFFERASRSTPHYSALSSYENIFAERRPGLDRDEIERRARQLIMFPSSGPEVGTILEFCADGIVCDFVGDGARIPYAGRHYGLEALINIVRAVAVDFEQTHCETHEMIIEGGQVAGRRRVEWRHRGTGRCGIVDLANFVRFEDGKIVELIEFRDSVTLLAMQGKMETPLSRVAFL
jgi:ketosteroid isomerase-like protein